MQIGVPHLLFYEVRRTVEESLANWNPELDDLIRIVVPPVSACTERKVCDGGTYQAVKEYLLDVGYIPDEAKIAPLEIERPICCCHLLPAGNCPDSCTTMFASELVVKGFLEEWKYQEEETEAYMKVYNSARAEVFGKDSIHRKVKPVALAEAGKVRTITKGSGLRAFLLSPIQKSLHGALRNHRCYRLIGEELTVEHLSILDPEEDLFFGRSFHSGDWKASTNGIYREVSEVCVDAVCDVMERRLCAKYGPNFVIPHVPWEFYSLHEGNAVPRHYTMKDYCKQIRIWFHDTLTKNRIFHPEDEAYKDQTIGQLMGSKLSFPILCLINAALCRWAMEVDQRKILPMSTVKMLINGDDNLHCLSQRGYWVKKKMAGMFGFYYSPGKVFQSRTYANINSTGFRYDPVLKRFKRIGYVNWGLLKGMKRSAQSGEDSKKSVGLFLSESSPVGSTVKALVADLPEEIAKTLRALLRKRLVRLRKGLNDTDYLARLLDEVPWNLPEELAGLGMGGQPSRMDLIHVGTALKKGWVFPRYTPETAVDMVTHQLVLRDLAPHTIYVKNPGLAARSHYQSVYGFLAKRKYLEYLRVFDDADCSAYFEASRFTKQWWNQLFFSCKTGKMKNGKMVWQVNKMKTAIDAVERRPLRRGKREGGAERSALSLLRQFWRGVRSDPDLYYGEKRPIPDLVREVSSLEPVLLLERHADKNVLPYEECELYPSDCLTNYDVMSDLAACDLYASEILGMQAPVAANTAAGPRFVGVLNKDDDLARCCSF